MTSAEAVSESVEEVELELHGVLYTVSVLVHGEELLVVRIEDRDTLDTWHGEFAAKYVEDITAKTGSFKKFHTFVRMLTSAVLGQSDSVFVDLLTAQDLELLKAKKAAAAAAASAGGDAAGAAGASAQQQQQLRPQLPPGLASKRYLILTYASEFDRVHYPLPLLPDAQPDPARFRAVIASLRQQLAAVQEGLSQQQQQQHPGGLVVLSGRQQQQRGYGGRGAADQAGAADVSLLASRLEVAQAELDGERAAHRREMRKKAREVQELQEELGRSRDVARELRLRIKTLEADLEAARLSSSSAAGGVGSKGGYRRPAAADRYSYGHSSYLAGSSKFPSRPTHSSSGNQQYPSSRNTSRGSSPASSRGQSPSYARPWAQNSSPTRPPRPSSAPPKQRFDPTEYVRQKREQQQRRLEAARRSSSANSRGGGGGGSPAPSVRSGGRGGGGDLSGASTPRSNVSRTSFDRRSAPERGAGALLQRSGSSGGGRARGGVPGELRGSSSSSIGGGGLYGRSGSLQRQAGGSSGGGYDVARPGSAGRQLLVQGRPGSSGSSRDQLGAIYGVAAAAGGGGRAGSRSSSRQRLDRDTASGRDGPGAASPGRALQGVRDKLDAYYAKQQQRTHAGAIRTAALAASPASKPGAASPRQQLPSTGLQPPGSPSTKGPAGAAAGGSGGAGGIGSSSSGVFRDASSEIADIDQRLHALQNFLKMAKSSVKGAA